MMACACLQAYLSFKDSWFCVFPLDHSLVRPSI